MAKENFDAVTEAETPGSLLLPQAWRPAVKPAVLQVIS
jgi:hypothetical protein